MAFVVTNSLMGLALPAAAGSRRGTVPEPDRLAVSWPLAWLTRRRRFARALQSSC